ncbi:penicillin-binding transpeptidase domain-containing protein [Nonomuraea sp. NPDC049269]|uniref:penicillin-binding transpeptidase domain-containing protein n=1 Tax=Nonomuraea sp. NPDC049269 TaxID=3364349 RepID=UPI00371721C3
MNRVRRGLAATVTLAVASMSLTACFEESSPHDAVRDFLVGWQSEDYDLAAGRTDGDRATVRKALSDAKVELDAASFRFKIKSISLNGDQSQADFHAEVDLGENNPLWAYDGMLPLRLVDGRWKVHWSPSVLHPQLKEGQRFAVSTDSNPRQSVLDRNNKPLQGPQFLYVVGVTPSTLGGQAEEVVEQLSEITGFAQDRLLSRIRSSPPKQFVQLANFGAVRYRALKDKIEQIPQLKTHKEEQPVAPDDPKDIVGKVSALTPEDEQKLGGPQRAGDSFGQSGLQRAYQNNLTGSTQTRVITLDLKTDNEVAQLKEWPGRTNVPVRTTIDKAKQSAADAAVAATETSALVAVDRSTGEILAVGTQGLNQEKDALAGRFPAGTAFSIVAADALIKARMNTKQRLACPAERTVGGARFVTASQVTGASPTFRDNFAKGCVTALASLARRVDAAALAKSAAAFGIGKDWRLPLKSFSGSLPKSFSGPLPTASDADKAMAIAGQNVEVSPLSMALVAGAIASGSWHAPVLVTEPKSPDPSAEVVSLAAPQPVPVDPKVRSALTAMMLAGAKSSRALAGHTGVHGVTAAGDSEKHMGWFVGWQGEVAIAVLTKNYDPAAVAGEFFSALRDSP